MVVKFFLSFKSSVRFSSLKILNQKSNEKVAISKIRSIKESVGYLVGYLGMSHLINSLNNGKVVECQYS